MSKKQALWSELAKARAHVARLESQLFNEQATPTSLSSSVNQYHDVFSTLTEGVQILSFDWHYLYVNEASARYGWQSKDILLSSTVTECYPGIENTPLFAFLRTCMEERIPQHFEGEFAFSNAEVAWFDVRVQPIPDGICVLFTDTMARKKVEETPHLSEEMFSSAFSLSAAGLSITRIVDGKFIDANQSFCDIFEYSRDEVIGRTYMELNIWSPEEHQKLIYQQKETGGLHNFELNARSKSGRHIHVLISSNELQLRNDLCHVMTVIDITKRKQADETIETSELRFRSLIEAVEDYAIYLLDAGGHIVNWNTGAERLKGYRSDEIVGQHFSRFFTPEEQHSAKPQQLLDMAELEGRVETEGWRVCKDGSRFWANGIITAIRNPDGSLDGFVKITRDLTQRKRAEENIRKLHRTLGVLSDINQAIVRIRHLPSLFEKACEIAVEKGAFRMAWIGMFDLETKSIYPVAHDGISHNDLEQLVLTLNASPIVGALHAGERLICNNIQNDPMWMSWCEEASRLSCNATVVLPLIMSGEIRGIFNLHAGDINFFDEQEMRLMDEMAMDISHAMEVAEQDRQRQTAEATLRTSEEKYRGLIESSESVIAVFDVEGTFLFANRVAAAGLGLTQETLTGRNLTDVFPPPSAQGQLARIQQVIQTGEGTIYEAISVVMGQDRWYRSSIQPIRDGSGQVTSALVNTVDITRIKQAEAELRNERDKLEHKVAERTSDLQAALLRVEAILNNSPDTILLVHSDLTIQQANSSFNTLFASEWNTYFGKSLLNLFHPDGAPSPSDLLETTDHQQNGKRIEVRAIRKDGTTFDAELNIGVIEGDGLVCIIRDITERKAHERQLRYHASLQASVSDAVIVLDMANNVQSWNKAAEDVYGWTAEEAVGQQSSKFLHYEVSPEQHERDMRHVQEYGWLKGEIKQFHKDGHPIYIWSSITLFKDEQGNPFSFVAVNHDITERKAQERQLRYHASLQEGVSDAVIATDMDFKIQSWNRAAETIYGWSAEEAIGKLVNELFQTTYESEEERNRILRDFLERGAWQGEVIQHHRDGSPINILASVNLFKDDMGQPFGIVSVNRDITERKRTAEALQKSSAEIRDLYNNAPCGYHSIDKDGLIVQINDTELRWLGYTRDEVVGKLKITDICTPESLLIYQKLRPALIKQGWLNDVEVELVRKDGSIIQILLNATTVYDDEGQFLQSRATLFDVTELQQVQRAIRVSESRYRLLAENIADVIMTFSLDRVITYMSPSCERLLGYLPEEVEGKSHSEFIHPDDYSQVLARTRQAVVSKENYYTSQFRLRHKAGQYIWYEVRTRIILDQDTGNVLQFISILRDITERKRAEDALHESEERLRTIIENIPVMVGFFDVAGRFEFVNQYWLDQVGWTVEDLITAEDPLTLFYPDPEYRQHVLEYMLSAEPGWRNFNSQTKHRGERITSWANVHLSDGRSIGIGQDITERQQAETALRESEVRFRRAIIDAPFPIMIHAEDGEIIQISKQWTELSGYTYEEIPTIGDWTEKAYGNRRESVKTLIDTVYARTEPLHGGEFRVRTKSGKERIWDFIAAPLGLMPDGRRMVSSMAMDITERKQAEEMLRVKMEEERQFQSHLTELHEIVIELTAIDELDTFYKRAVELGRERFGFERLAMLLYDAQDDTAIGTYGTDIQGELVDERGVRFKPDPNGIMQRSFERPERFYFNEETTLYHNEQPVGSGWNAAVVLWNGAQSLGWFVADNLLSHMPASTSLLHIMGLYALSVGTLLAQKQVQFALSESEQKYRSLVETMRGGLAVFDTEFRVTYVNDRFCELLGYSRVEAIGKQLENFMAAPHTLLVQSHLERRENAESSSYEIPLRHKDGHQIFTLLSGSPLLDKQGKYNGSIVVATDISMQKQAEDTLRQALVKEKELGDLKTRFVSMASHEFRTPLATILATTDTLSAYRHKLTEEQIEQRFDKIKDQVGYLKDIMEDVLMLARMQARRVEFNPVKLDLDALARSVLDEFVSRPDIKHRLEYAISQSNQEVMLDRKLMRQIISNLVSNAIKYSPEDKVIHIRLQCGDGEVSLEISDEGIGIPEADLPHLFEPFHRAANVGTISGTGLGLVITKEAVELHSGTIAVESQQGIGTTFIIRIPISAGGGQKTLKILVIEDETGLREEVLEWMKLEGYEAFGAADGVAGVNEAFRRQPDLIISDITMPLLDGHGVLLELRANPSTVAIPFIFMSARASHDDVRNGMDLGAADYVRKPFTRLELLRAIQSCLEKK